MPSGCSAKEFAPATPYIEIATITLGTSGPGGQLPEKVAVREKMTSGFWDFLWLIIWSFFLISYLMVLFQIIGDIFRDNGLGGFAKAIWIIALLVLPLLTALLYILARGGGMARRRNEDFRRSTEEAESYIRGVAGRSAATEISEANTLLQSGAISQAEFDRLKAKALA
jgi:hypothetical protein